MMQVPKQDVREAIRAAATREFAANGYKKASMRAIARGAGVTPGNIYAYFSSKEQLFAAVVAPVAAHIDARCRLDFPDGAAGMRHVDIDSPLVLEEVIAAITQVFLAFRSEFFILLHGSEGSPFAGRKAEMIAAAARPVHEYLLRGNHDTGDSALLAEALSAAVIEGLCVIFHAAGADEARLAAAVGEYLRRLFAPGVHTA